MGGTVFEETIAEAGYDADSSDDNFAYVPNDGAKSDRVFKIGDAQHVKLAVSAFVNWEFRGNAPKVPTDAKPGIKRKIAAAIHKHLTGDDEKYYSKWLSTGKKPDKSVREMISFDAPYFTFADEPLYPDVPLFPDINVSELTSGDPDPLFVTRPLGVLNEVSSHGLIYDETLLQMMDNQIRSKRPVARQGHVPEDEKDSLFPDDKAIWVGSLRDGTTQYGKAYILPGTHFNRMVRARKAAKTDLSTSIWGNGSYVDNGNGTVRCIDLALESIDFVPAERAALQALPGQFETTSEMSGDTTMGDEQHGDAAADLDLLKTAIASIKPEDVYEMVSGPQRAQFGETFVKNSTPAEMYEMMPAGHRAHVAQAHVREMASQEVYEMMTDDQRKSCAEMHATKTGQKMVPVDAGIVTSGAVSEMASMQSSIAEMSTTIKRYEREEFDRAVLAAVDGQFADWRVTADEGKAKVNAAKQNFKVVLIAEMAGSTRKEDIAPAVAKAWETFKPMAEMTRASLTGPNAFVGASSFAGGGTNRYGYNPQTGRYSEEAMENARAATNSLNTTKRGV